MSKSISFVSESQIEEKRKLRQEEWEKTRKEDDPIEPPEEKYDPRTLYERLQEQKLKKKEEFEESRKLKNMIKVLDNDEIEFLQAVDESKAEIEIQKYREEMLAIEECKREMNNLNAEEQEKRLLEFKRELFTKMKQKRQAVDGESEIAKKKSTQAALLSKIVVKRKPQTLNENKLAGEDNTLESVSKKSKLERAKEDNQESKSRNSSSSSSSENCSSNSKPAAKSSTAIGLPGIVCYDDDSESSEQD